MKAQCAVAVILDDKGRALLARRSPHKRSAPGYWSPVAGEIHRGESEQAAVVRETREEVGLVVDPIKKVGEFDTRDGSARLHWWLVEKLDGVARLCNGEHTELRWFDFGELSTLNPAFEEDISVLRKIQAEWLVQEGPTPVIGTETVETGRFLHMFTPRLPVPEVNCVWRSILSPEGGAQEIDQIIQRHRFQSLPLWWLVSPNSGPDNLGNLLEERGLEKEFDAFALGLETDKLSGATSPDISVTQMNQENSQEYWKVFGKAPNPTLQEWTNYALRGKFGELEFFYAAYKGELAGAAAHRIFGGTSFLMSGFTKPEFRHRGVYRELLRYRIKALRERDVSWALTLSKSDTSAPILKNLGFQEFGKYRMYTLPKKKAENA